MNTIKGNAATRNKLILKCCPTLNLIDIIAKDGSYLVFVEVKYRKSAAKGTGLEAVNFKKMRKISRVADFYMYSHHMDGNTSVRFDVIAIEEGHLKHIKNAFEYIPVC